MHKSDGTPGMGWTVVYRGGYLHTAEMFKELLRDAGVPAVVRARDPFGAFANGPHLGRYQPTTGSTYEVLVPEGEEERAKDLIGDRTTEDTSGSAEK